MEVILCDTKGCGAIIKGEQTRAFTKGGDGWGIQITLTEEADRCAECSRKMFARAASATWNDLKQVRKAKKTKEVDGGS